MLGTCPAHGAYDAPACPTCGREGTPLATEERRIQLSKFLSGALRHFPGDVGLSPDRQGWVPADALLQAAQGAHPWADAETVEAVLLLDPKGRFEVDPEQDRVRAAYGHSIDVDLEPRVGPGHPSVLYHGTAPANVDPILEQGLRPMTRQEVHLSPDVDTAREVGARHAREPVILRVDADALAEAGIEVHRRSHAVYTCKRVPPACLTLHRP